MDYPAPGGSVLVSCRVDDIIMDSTLKPLLDGNGDVQRIAHGYVREYHLYIELIRGHLRAMIAGGQRRLAIAVPYFRGGNTFYLDSGGGKMQTRDRANLIALIRDAIAVGFVDILLELIPGWFASYDNWQKVEVMGSGNTRAWQPIEYAELMGFTFEVDLAAAEACAPTQTSYWIDLLGECANKEVGARLSHDWIAMHGGTLGRSLGFSTVPTQASLDLIPQMYPDGILPGVWLMHPYWPKDYGWFKAALRARYGAGVICSETSCNDPAMAQAFAADKADLFWIHQWPFLSGTTPATVTQDRLTLEYNEYASRGL